MPFFMLGDPDFENSFSCIKAAIDAGADALELGIPFSDPIADGPVIQAASDRALDNNMNIKRVLKLIEKIRIYHPNIPMGVLVYFNLIFKNGFDYIHNKLKQAGIDAVLAVDLPLEENAEHNKSLAKYNLGAIQLIAPNTPDDRAKLLLNQSTAFTYVVSHFGTTGVRKEIGQESIARVKHLASLSNDTKPLVVGFGISNAAQVKQYHDAGAHGAIIGSAIVKIIANNLSNIQQAEAEIKKLVSSCV